MPRYYDYLAERHVAVSCVNLLSLAAKVISAHSLNFKPMFDPLSI